MLRKRIALILVLSFLLTASVACKKSKKKQSVAGGEKVTGAWEETVGAEASKAPVEKETSFTKANGEVVEVFSEEVDGVIQYYYIDENGEKFPIGMNDNGHLMPPPSAVESYIPGISKEDEKPFVKVDPETELDVENGKGEDITASKYYKTLQILDSKVYTTKVDLAGNKVLTYRDNNSVVVNVIGFVEIIIDGKKYIFNNGTKTGKYRPATQEEIESNSNTVNMNYVDMSDAKVAARGKEVFNSNNYRDEGEFLYEEITDSSGTVIRAYFNGDDIIGIRIMGTNGEYVYTEYTVTAGVPSDVFVIPSDYTLIEDLEI